MAKAAIVWSLASAVAGYFIRLFTSNSDSEKPSNIEKQVNNVIVKDAVNVENHNILIVGVFIIATTVIIAISIFAIHKCLKSFKKKVTRRTQLQRNEARV